MDPVVGLANVVADVRGGQMCNNSRAKWFGLFIFILLSKRP